MHLGFCDWHRMADALRTYWMRHQAIFFRNSSALCLLCRGRILRAHFVFTRLCLLTHFFQKGQYNPPPKPLDDHIQLPRALQQQP